MRRFLAAIVVLWLCGFVVFAIALPQPLEGEKTDLVVVPTGAGGRIARGLEVLDKGWTRHVLVTGVDPEVKRGEFAAEYKVSADVMKCCVTLGSEAADTRGNALETAEWVASHKVKSLRLVTTDWHMRRAAHELSDKLSGDVEVKWDAVPSKPSFRTLFLEYNKLLASYLSLITGG